MKVLLFANTEWYLFNFRLSLARALRDAGHEVLLVSPPGPYGQKLRDIGFRWESAPMVRRSLNPLREFALVQWLRRLIAREQVDLVHGFTIKCAVYGSIAARLAGIPARVNAVAGMGYVFTSNEPRALVLRPIIRNLLRFALDGEGARLILQNPDDVDLFARARLVKPERVRLIPGSGVDCSRFTPPTGEAAPASKDRFRVLLPARLLWDKGVAEYVDAGRQVRAAGLPIDFLLAGDPDPGNPAAVPEAVIKGWVAEGVVEWLGHVHDMPGLFHSVDAVVLPSYREGLPKGLIEAAACGLPIVTTDVPGCREVVTDDVDGLLVPARNATALAAAIVRLHAEPALRKRVGAAARAKAVAEFDEQRVVERTLGVYRELIPGL
ncbi:glycosyltransferase family 4 protein [Ramlibacter montanisoli]|uniref:Glycosyltransferase family 4 protein n=1 Tax=Ramlibacter montanisoli TaxID=2732512 RepID=A0A849KC07_9BURK|nr:glycosyltransferase family 4 protein [Ramlibacter montanisoli]NNU43677.1 glycosyltransferase family 4 protein [Ramlibacter montanisoli]